MWRCVVSWCERTCVCACLCMCMAAVNASPFILSQYRGIAVICSFCTPFNRGALSFHPAMPAFVLTNKKRNRWIKSFNYPCEGKAVTVHVCVWYYSPCTVSGQRSGCHGNSGWGLEKMGRGSREQTVGKGRGERAREVWRQMGEGEIQTFNYALIFYTAPVADWTAKCVVYQYCEK